jgi:hypothetical protein
VALRASTGGASAPRPSYLILERGKKLRETVLLRGARLTEK